jgi:hypothetical protein
MNQYYYFINICISQTFYMICEVRILFSIHNTNLSKKIKTLCDFFIQEPSQVNCGELLFKKIIR